MRYRTTYMMTQDTIDKLQMAENKTKVDSMELIIHAMRMLIHEFEKVRNHLGPVEYQKRFDEQSGEKIIKYRVKVTMDRRENIQFQDMRRFYFKSISLLIAIAINRYLDRIIEYYLAKFFEDRRDNYPSGNWIYKEKCTENATCIKIWFGAPPNILKELFD